MKKIWHSYDKWEDYKFGMYSSPDKASRPLLKTRVSALMMDVKSFELAMKRVVREWPISTEHNLSCASTNRRAWLGQAACAIELSSSEDLTRECWGEMNNFLKYRANCAADRVIKKWVAEHERQNIQVHFYVGVEGLSFWYSRRSRPKARGNGSSAIVQTDLQGNFEERLGANVLGFFKRENRVVQLVKENRNKCEARK